MVRMDRFQRWIRLRRQSQNNHDRLEFHAFRRFRWNDMVSARLPIYPKVVNGQFMLGDHRRVGFRHRGIGVYASMGFGCYWHRRWIDL